MASPSGGTWVVRDPGELERLLDAQATDCGPDDRHDPKASGVRGRCGALARRRGDDEVRADRNPDDADAHPDVRDPRLREEAGLFVFALVSILLVVERFAGVLEEPLSLI